MAWILLIIAGLFEIGWPLGFKLASMHKEYHNRFQLSTQIFYLVYRFIDLIHGLKRLFLISRPEKHPDRYGLCNLDRDRGYRDCSSWNLVFP